MTALSVSDAPVRFLIAPLGAGKTTALRAYAAQRNAAFVSVYPGCTWEELQTELERSADAGEVIIDGADLLDAGAIGKLLGLLEDARDPRRFLVAGRSRRVLAVQRFLAAGLADLFDYRLLALTCEDIAELAAGVHLDADTALIDQLRYDTDGWALAVLWILREAAANGTLRHAVESWRERNGHLVLEMLDDAVESDGLHAAWEQILSGSFAGDVRTMLERLEAHGYPIVRGRSGPRPYRLIVRLARPSHDEGVPKTPTPGVLIVKLFGEVSAQVDGRAVAFARRRDLSVLVYVALSPFASVSRRELMRAFWPDALPSVASQGLRTALSRLRRAIAAAAHTDAGTYLRVGHNIALDLDRVTVDVRRFAERVELARLSEARGELATARANYAIAERIYAGPLLASVGIEPPLLRCVVESNAVVEAALGRLLELHLVQGDTASAQRTARRLARQDGGDQVAKAPSQVTAPSLVTTPAMQPA